MSQFRVNIVLQAFKKLDLDGDGEISLVEIKQIYNAK